MKQLVYLIFFIILVSCNQTANTDGRPIDDKKDIDNEKTLANDSSVINSHNPCDSINCDLNQILTIFSDNNTLTKDIIDAFMLTLNSCCSNNVELIEYCNGMIFKILDYRPDLFLLSYSDNIDELDTAWINLELQRPINDNIPLKEIIEKVDSIDFDDKIKGLIISNLNKGKWWE